MAKFSALKTLLQLAQTRTDDAAKRLGMLHAQGVHMETRLGVLQQYREDYRTRFQTQARQGLTAAGWRNYQEFLERLDAAILQQEDAVSSTRERVAAGRIAWQSARRTYNSYETLTQRQIQAELQRATKREQKETDEHVNNIAARQDSVR
ncbi:flagellar export protein FliJ [Nitrosovibrio sp. Nv17]|uniref:flagellar export protein FliJ n=1 Tax=Nitrosovibrio sp. Nv17 TaxID=1855339 RepID=UPI00090877D7|nr:flagellar export protein FliJ [Nitrosovibrio sp. Nv17]SFW14453.1 flagellar FliJ protein [Nitrosovibrio sp. Nv17]